MRSVTNNANSAYLGFMNFCFTVDVKVQQFIRDSASVSKGSLSFEKVKCYCILPGKGI